MLKSIYELKDTHKGRPAAVLGAGHSLPGDLAKVPAGAVMIGVNGHAERLVRLDYMCFADSPKHRPKEMAWVNNFIGRRLTFIDGFSDWRVDVPHWYFGLTFPFAVWAALWMGCDPVLLCGFDCHAVSGHFYEPEGGPDIENYHKHMHIWRRTAEAVGVDRWRIRAVSGPLVLLFGKDDRAAVKHPERIRVQKLLCRQHN